MKKYLVFIGENYYPMRFYDYKITCNSLQEAKEFIMLNKDPYDDWYDIIEVTDEDTKLVDSGEF